MCEPRVLLSLKSLRDSWAIEGQSSEAEPKVERELAGRGGGVCAQVRAEPVWVDESRREVFQETQWEEGLKLDSWWTPTVSGPLSFKILHEPTIYWEILDLLSVTKNVLSLSFFISESKMPFWIKSHVLNGSLNY